MKIKQTQEEDKVHAVSPLSWAAAEQASEKHRSLPHTRLIFSSFNKKTPASLSQLREQGSYHQLSLTTALCYLTLLIVGTTQPFLRRGREAHKRRLENSKLVLAICINKLCGVPRGKGCLPCACVRGTVLTLSSFQKSWTTTTTSQGELMGVVGSHLPRKKKKKKEEGGKKKKMTPLTTPYKLLPLFS